MNADEVSKEIGERMNDAVKEGKRARQVRNEAVNLVCRCSEAVTVTNVLDSLGKPDEMTEAVQTRPVFEVDWDMTMKCDGLNLDQCFALLRKDGTPGINYSFIRMRADTKRLVEKTIRDFE